MTKRKTSLSDRTSRCVYCERPANHWCGHILNGKKKILAGWCEKHDPGKPPGFYGHYKASFK